MKIKYLPVVLVCAFLALWPKAEAVVPSPDGGYPNGNPAEGQNALLNLTSGGFNAAVGWLSLWNLTTGNFNTGVGAGTLALNTAEENTPTSTGALLFNTTGFQNTANGTFALFNNDIGNLIPPLVSKLSLAILKAFPTPLSAFRHSKTTSAA